MADRVVQSTQCIATAVLSLCIVISRFIFILERLCAVVVVVGLLDRLLGFLMTTDSWSFTYIMYIEILS